MPNPEVVAQVILHPIIPLKYFLLLSLLYTITIVYNSYSNIFCRYIINNFDVSSLFRIFNGIADEIMAKSSFNYIAYALDLKNANDST
ncbi:hypothetical protein [Pedobacter chinensis]|uniref:hypothetical protein n=1 Tax=Pedobacter chinensis TaxID=2282421 RepID=UPI0011C06F1F|nr:hypothetical protein [Pedobacter chinensis]